ncbi:hypothetical protein GGF31_008849 [Allomyces arbusculus]|nr:hypothetical protein GGF31_008849 [Allomyces arbusculus]
MIATARNVLARAAVPALAATRATAVRPALIAATRPASLRNSATCPCCAPTRLRAFSTTRAVYASETDSLLADLATKLQNSPAFLKAVQDFQDTLAAKGITPDQLAKPSVKLFQVLADKDVRAKTEALALALREAGVTDDQVRAAAQEFSTGSLFSGLFSGKAGNSSKPE